MTFLFTATCTIVQSTRPIQWRTGDQGVRAWIQLGVPANKVAIGLPFYGYAWNLVNANNHGLFAPASGAVSLPSRDGSLGYGEIRDFISNQGAQHACV